MDIREETGNGNRYLMQLIGDSKHRTRLTFEPNAIFCGENNSLKTIGSDMQERGVYACLDQQAGNTGRRGIVVRPRVLDLTMHQNTGRTQSI